MYVIIELQTTGDTTTVVTPISAYNDLSQAYNKYYTVLAAAAVSSVDIHAAMIIGKEGNVIRTERFVHNQKEEVNE